MVLFKGKQRIKGGPSSWDIMLALFDPRHHHVNFKLVSGPLSDQVVEVNIEALIRRDSGTRFFFDGLPINLGGGGFWVRGAFSTKSREGWLEFTSGSDRGWAEFAEDLPE